MREYHLFLSTDSGAFGVGRTVWMTDDQAAIEVGQRLLYDVSGVDIWDSKKRVALLKRPAARHADAYSARS
ncbi:MAG TPA: hypothetical protein VG983_01060 [Caulobacterales bacterium]|jgi:hypothetical protein|nr:hypothetical protein [Caulobacterales bacterium]